MNARIDALKKTDVLQEAVMMIHNISNTVLMQLTMCYHDDEKEESEHVINFSIIEFSSSPDFIQAFESDDNDDEFMKSDRFLLMHIYERFKNDLIKSHF